LKTLTGNRVSINVNTANTRFLLNETFRRTGLTSALEKQKSNRALRGKRLRRHNAHSFSLETARAASSGTDQDKIYINLGPDDGKDSQALVGKHPIEVFNLIGKELMEGKEHDVTIRTLPRQVRKMPSKRQSSNATKSDDGNKTEYLVFFGYPEAYEVIIQEKRQVIQQNSNKIPRHSNSNRDKKRKKKPNEPTSSSAPIRRRARIVSKTLKSVFKKIFISKKKAMNGSAPHLVPGVQQPRRVVDRS
jgi:hypothetical protein